MVPPPRLVATAAPLAPDVETSRSDALIFPPPAAMIPCAYWPDAVIVTPEITTDEPDP